MRRRRKEGRKHNFFLLGGFLVFLLILLASLGTYLYKVFISKQNENTPIIQPQGVMYMPFSVERALQEKHIDFESVYFSSSSAHIIGDLKDGTQVFFSREKDIEWQVSSLQSIIQKLTIDNKKPRLIDLRFAKPIVKL